MPFVARIYVTPRADVLDPQGNAVGRALVSLGFDGVSDVTIGRYLELQVNGADRDEAAKTVEAMCESLLIISQKKSSGRFQPTPWVFSRSRPCSSWPGARRMSTATRPRARFFIGAGRRVGRGARAVTERNRRARWIPDLELYGRSALLLSTMVNLTHEMCTSSARCSRK